MQTYYLSGSNGFTIRVKDVAPISGSYNFGAMHLQDMTTLVNSTMTLSNVSYSPYESLFSFTGSIANATTGSEYRAYLTDAASQPIWYGSFQVFRPQTIDKANYTNQNNQYISNVSENKYVILD
jgi:hypothetical protein